MNSDVQNNLAPLMRGLPREIVKKINKTKQTRGAQPYNRVVYQNRVNRNNIAVVPYPFRDRLLQDGFENGYVILVRPEEYFASADESRADFDSGVVIGENAFVYYDNRQAYVRLPPLSAWQPRQRGGPGEVVYRLPATTAAGEEGAARVEGQPQGIRFFEYASSEQLYRTCIQLAMLAWRTEDIEEVRTEGIGDAAPEHLSTEADRLHLWDEARLTELGVLHEGRTICPLCRAQIKALELMTRVEQTEGREVSDLTITEVNLFHMKDLRPGEYNHREYLLGWGHHHCNAVARDQGVTQTLSWMADVLRRNGYEVSETATSEHRKREIERE